MRRLLLFSVPTRCLFALVVIVSLFAAVCSAPGAAINNASYFSRLPHTYINFETYGAGLPTIPGPLFGDEYAGQGVAFSSGPYSVVDLADTAQKAISIGGGGPTTIVNVDRSGGFFMTFSTSVKAFGFWVVDNNEIAVTPVFTAMNADGEVIGSATFGPAFQAGSVGDVDYGFMGIATDQDISSVRIDLIDAELDDLRFSAVPEPSTMSLVLLFGALGLFSRSYRRG